MSDKRLNGTVVRFDDAQGTGAIVPKGQNNEIFLHRKNMKHGHEGPLLSIHAYVEFSIETIDGKPTAVEVILAERE